MMGDLADEKIKLEWQDISSRWRELAEEYQRFMRDAMPERSAARG